MRNLTTGMVSAVTAQVMHPVIFFEGEFADGGGEFVRVWSGYGTIQWNGLSWTGVGHLGGISAIEESSDFRANVVTVSLSGIPAALVSTALGSTRQGLPGRIWIGEMAEGDDSKRWRRQRTEELRTKGTTPALTCIRAGLSVFRAEGLAGEDPEQPREVGGREAGPLGRLRQANRLEQVLFDVVDGGEEALGQVHAAKLAGGRPPRLDRACPGSEQPGRVLVVDQSEPSPVGLLVGPEAEQLLDEGRHVARGLERGRELVVLLTQRRGADPADGQRRVGAEVQPGARQHQVGCALRSHEARRDRRQSGSATRCGRP